MKHGVLLASVLSLPALAVGLVGYFWFAAAQNPALAARLWLWESDDRLLVRAFVGSYPLGQAPPPVEVEFVVQSSDQSIRRSTSTTSRDGVADFSLHGARNIVSVALMQRSDSGDGDVLFRGAPELLDVGAWMTPSTSPDLRPKPPLDALQVHISTGVLAVPFRSQVRVEHDDVGCFARISGAVVDDERSCCNGCSVYPTEHVVELELGHAPDQKLGTVLLPVVPGAMPISTEDEKVFVYSATPRDIAHVAWITDTDVLGLSSVKLFPRTVDAGSGLGLARAGTRVHVGTTTFPPEVAKYREQGAMSVVTSSEPDFVSSATVAWPLPEAGSGRGTRFVPRVNPGVLDGFAQHERSARAATIVRRQQLLVGLGGVLVLEFVLLASYVKLLRGQRDVDLPSERRASFVTAMLCLGLAFAGLLALFWWK